LILGYERRYKKVIRVQELLVIDGRVGISKREIRYKVDARFPLGGFQDLGFYHGEVMEIKESSCVISPCFSNEYLEVARQLLSPLLERCVINDKSEIYKYLYKTGNFLTSSELLNSFDEMFFKTKYRLQFALLKEFFEKNMNIRLNRGFQVMSEFGGLDREVIVEFRDLYE
jgi:hypothetical protein